MSPEQLAALDALVEAVYRKGKLAGIHFAFPHSDVGNVLAAFVRGQRVDPYFICLDEELKGLLNTVRGEQ